MDSLRIWFREHAGDISHWLRDSEQGIELPLYVSVDIRDAGYKAAVVDANAFPAGWNNLPSHAATLATEALSEYFARHFPGVTRIGIIPENHTRNKYYFDNVDALLHIVRDAGYQAEITHVNSELSKDISTFEGTHDNQISLLQLERDGTRAICNTFEPDVFILNNDLAGGVPEILDGITQPIVPITQLGWFKRRKSRHFEITNRLLKRFGEHFGIDPWKLSAIFSVVQHVHFGAREGLDEIATALDTTVSLVEKKYEQYKIENGACAFIKDNSGTYGQGIMHAVTGDEVRNMNRKTINQMDVGKGNVRVDEVLIQECIPTRFTKNALVGEPVFYMMGDTVVGGFARVNAERGPRDNLNAQGTYFTTLETLDESLPIDVYEFLTRIARIAIGYEIGELK